MTEEEEEEKLLMEVITSDAADVATTLKKLLRCGEKLDRLQK